jgi:DNA-binding NarL/FixJ family response regulator
MSKIRIVIADDRPIVARGLRQALTSEDAFDVVAEAADGEAAIARIQELSPDVAILDVDMPKKDGVQVVQAIKERRLPTAVIFLTMHQNESLLQAALDLGVRGYV